MHANMVVEMPDSDSGSETSSVTASGFMAMELDPAGCGGGDDASDSDVASDSDDDLDVIWEDENEAARDVDATTGREPQPIKSTGLPFRGGRSHSTPSTVVSRGGSFGGGESTPPSDSGSSNVSGSGSDSGSSKSRSRRDGIGSSDGGGGGSSPTVDGDGVTGESTVDGYAVLPPELSKAEAGRLKSWGRHGDAVVTSRLRSVRNRLVVASAEPGVEDETALMALVQDEEMQEAEETLNGHEYVDFMDSLATSPTDFDAHEYASNVLSLMCETAEGAPAEIALVVKETQGKSELE
eukprot:g6097.t1